MPIALQITLILVLLSLAIALLPLLFQLQRTVLGIDNFLVAVRVDIAQITEDVHASRLRMDRMSGSIQTSLSEISAFAKSIGELGSTLTELHSRYRNSLEAASRNMGAVMGGISTVLAFFKSNRNPQAPE